MELIDRHTLIDGFLASCNTGYESFPLDFICEAIEQVPAVDAVPVVRCRECKLYEPVEGGKPYCAYHAQATFSNDYCSYGERKAALNAEKG